MKVIALTVLVCLGWCGRVAAINCNPVCSGNVLGDQVPDPYNCTNFYYCLGDGTAADHPSPCDPGQHFDEATSKCVEGEECDPKCQGANCHLTCSKVGDYVVDVRDCTKYYSCIPGGVTGPYYCTSDHPFFDGTSCVDDDGVCCKDVCEPYCPGGGVALLVPDPNDCKRYYLCPGDFEGEPDETKHFTCGNGNFNIQTAQCSVEAECINICEETTDPEGPTTTTTTTTTSPGDTTTTTTTSPGDTTTTTTTSPGDTTTTTPTGDCVESFMCPGSGNYPACRTCQPQYFHCEGSGMPGVLKLCTDDKVFNTNPDYSFCILKPNCPYPSRWGI